MSMNIMITAEREVSFKTKSGEVKLDTQTIEFNAWQTPTVATKIIYGDLDPAEAYIHWITENIIDERVPLYDENDPFQDIPIGFEIFNAGKEHIDEFMNWLAYTDLNGFTVQFDIT